MTESRELVRRLGTFLADLTKDRRAERIHAEIIERLRNPGLLLDHRLAGVYLQDKDFIPIWTAIRNGAALPSTSWETVVLPTVVYFSPEATLKGNLEIAARLFLAAREAVTAPAEPTAIPANTDTSAGTEPAPVHPASAEPTAAPANSDTPAGTEPPRGHPAPTERDLAPVPEPPPELDALFRATPAFEPAPTGTAQRRGRRVLMLAGLVVAGTAALYFLPGLGQVEQAHSRLVPSKSLSPTPLPQISPSAVPSMSAFPVSPSPSLSPPLGIVAPSAPRRLASTAKTRTSVSLTWLAPSEPGTGGLDRYRIFAGGAEVAWTTRTNDTVLGLKPGTTYSFTVKAYSGHGKASPASNAITVRTDDPPPPTISPPSSVEYGASFSVAGGLWRCAAVNLYLGSYHVAVVKPDPGGEFTHRIEVKRNDKKEAVVDIVGGGQFHLTVGAWQVKASCGSLQAAPMNVTVKPETVTAG